MFWKFILFYSICVFSVSAQTMQIGVLRHVQSKKVLFSYFEGSYMIYADGKAFGSILPTESISIEVVANNKVRAVKGGTVLGEFSKVYLQATANNHSIRLKNIKPDVKERKYEDDFEVTNNGQILTIVNHVSMSDYLAGVVESEGGGGKHLDYYKVQAIISRTYALKYKNKHKKEGFQLCDQVHCQAYHQRLTYTPDIRAAVNSTDGVVMLDQSNKLVDGFFHANCGGQSCEPHYVWNETLPYLTSFKDTFCIHTRQAKWEKRIPKQEWENYLVNQFAYPIHDSVYKSKLFRFSQPERLAFYHGAELGIPLRDIRSHFNLKSTFFSCYPEGNDVVLLGRGYGHGVGMCQEGAMRMAKSGFDYVQIIKFYFPGVELKSQSTVEYYNQPEKSPFDF
jgi:stage II sporulation protein D